MATVASTEAQLVARCRDGDEAAWAELVDGLARYVMAICTSAFRMPAADAEDVFQEVFARAYRDLHRLQDDAAIRAWIGQITRRLCVDAYRRGTREGPAYEELPEQAAIDGAFEEFERALAVREAMRELPEHCQDMLDRFFAQDQSYREIAAATGVPSGTIASRISRCLAKMRTELVEA